MRRLPWITSLILIPLFAGMLSAQQIKSGFGPGGVATPPSPAQANSAGIDFSRIPALPDANWPANPSFTYDSKTGLLTVLPNSATVQALKPVIIGTEPVNISFSNAEMKPSAPDAFTGNYSMIHESRTAGYAWYINYGWSGFNTLLTNLGNQGYRIENLNTYGYSVFDYAGTWTYDTKGWAWALNYSDISSFVTYLNALPNGSTRYRPTEFAISRNGMSIYYGVVAVNDNLGFGWDFNETNQTTFSTWISGQYSANRRLSDIGFYKDYTGALYCSAITKDATFAQQFTYNLSSATFTSTNTTLLGQGYRLIDYDKYKVGTTYYYAGLWNKDGVGYAYELDYTDQTAFTNQVTSYISQGFKPIVVDIFDADPNDAVQAQEGTLPAGYALHQNYPNPFNPSTTIQYDLPRQSFVTVDVYNTLGERVATLVHEQKSAGRYEITWTPGANLSSGVYYCRMSAGDFAGVQKLLLVK